MPCAGGVAVLAVVSRLVSGIASRIASGLLRRVAWEAGLLVSHLAVGRDEGDDGNDAGLVEEGRHLGG